MLDKIKIFFLVIILLALLVLTGVTGYGLYLVGTFVLNEFDDSSNRFSVTETDDVTSKEGLPKKNDSAIDPIDSKTNAERFAEMDDSTLVSVTEYSAIHAVNYFSENDIWIYDDLGKAIQARIAGADVLVSAGTLRKLIIAEELLLREGYRLSIWVGYRDIAMQEKLREHLEITMGITEGRYDLVAEPGKSHHQLGMAVDVTVLYSDDSYAPVPTKYLDFSDARLPDNHVGNQALEVLQRAMAQGGMTKYNGEWWHFNNFTTDD